MYSHIVFVWPFVWIMHSWEVCVVMEVSSGFHEFLICLVTSLCCGPSICGYKKKYMYTFMNMCMCMCVCVYIYIYTYRYPSSWCGSFWYQSGAMSSQSAWEQGTHASQVCLELVSCAFSTSEVACMEVTAAYAVSGGSCLVAQPPLLINGRFEIQRGCADGWSPNS